MGRAPIEELCDDLVAQKLQIDAELGRGGMGRVLRAKDVDLNRDVALKVLAGKSDPSRFMAEAQITGQLDHPNVIPVHEFGVSSTGEPFFTMKLVRGHQSLREVIALLREGDPAVHAEFSFERRVQIVQRVCDDESVYLVNSINPYRIEGQKAIGFELLDQLGWEVPDWIVLPGGNLGNSSAIAKGMVELYNLGVIDRLPRIAIVQARGANPLYRAFSTGLSTVDPLPNADTIATAIRIGAPVSWRKCLRGIDACKGVVTDADDAEILDAKAMVDAAGIGAEPASCATVAGLRRLVREGVIKPGERIAGILTGHLLKDPDVVVNYHKRELEGVDARYANELVSLPADEETIIAHIRGKLT